MNCVQGNKLFSSASTLGKVGMERIHWIRVRSLGNLSLVPQPQRKRRRVGLEPRLERDVHILHVVPVEQDIVEGTSEKKKKEKKRKERRHVSNSHMHI